MSTQFGELRDQRGHILFLAAERRPIHPASRIVLTIGVVVATLAVADLVSRQQQRHALRQHEAEQEIAPQLASQLEDLGIVRRSLHPAIRAVILLRVVAIVLAVCLVVLALVAHEIGEREAIVDRDEIDARARAAVIVMEQIGRAGHAAAELADEVAFPGPVAPQRATKVVVPLRPAWWKPADLIASGAEVPRLSDELGCSQDRILPYGGKEGGAAIEAVRSAAERAGEIEPESVDVTDLHPEAQR